MRVSAKSIVLPAMLVLIAGAGLYLLQPSSRTADCASPLGGQRVLRSQLSSTSFGAVTKFKLPSPLRAANAITVAQDGSVWFGEQSVPGMAHLFPNGTFTEYAWPFDYTTPTSSGGVCDNKTDIWGIALWNGRVWAGDTSGNRIVALDPSTGSISSVKLTVNYSYPYTLTVGPDGGLWFTEVYGYRLGRIDAQGVLQQYVVPGGGNALPSQIVFANRSTGYFSDAGEAGAANGGIYSFNLTRLPEFSPRLVGGMRLNLPTSLALADNSVWAALHGASSVASYNFTSRTWSNYPTTYVNYTATTLPYFVDSNGSAVWFNEHYGDKLALLNPSMGMLSEFSLANPPAKNGSGIGNALSIALGDGRVWFTEWTANYVGFVNSSYDPGFSISVQGGRNLTVRAGSSADLTAAVSSSVGAVRLRFADSESFTSKPAKISLSPSSSVVSEGQVRIAITTSPDLPPGRYTLLVTATDGRTYESAFAFLNVVA